MKVDIEVSNITSDNGDISRMLIVTLWSKKQPKCVVIDITQEMQSRLLDKIPLKPYQDRDRKIIYR